MTPKETPSEVPTKEQLEFWAKNVGDAMGALVEDDVAAFLRSPALARALETMEAVEWVEARADVMASRTWSPSKGANWLVVHSAKRATSGHHDGLLEAVNALRAQLEASKEEGRGA